MAPGTELEEANKAVVMRYVEEAWNKANPTIVDEIFSTGATITRRTGTFTFNNETVKREILEWHRAFPDFRYIVHTLVADGDRVIVHRSMQGRQDGVFQNGSLGPWPPSGKEMDIWDMTIYRLDGGKIVELTAVWQRADFMEQIAPLATASS